TSDALASFAATYTRATAEEGQNAALGLNLQKPKEEVARMLTMPGGVPPNVNRRILEIGNGERYAQANIEDIRRRYNGENTAPQGQPSNAFDRDRGDLNQWFNGVVSEYQGQVPQSEGALWGWRRMMQHEQERLYAQHGQYLQDRTLQAN